VRSTLRTPILVSMALHALLACIVVTVKVTEPPREVDSGLMVLVQTHVAPQRRAARAPRPSARVPRPRQAADTLRLTRQRVPLVAARERAATAPILVPRQPADVPAYVTAGTPAAQPTGPSTEGGKRTSGNLHGSATSDAPARPTVERKEVQRAGLAMSTQTHASASLGSPANTPNLTLKTPLDLIAEHVVRSEMGDAPVDLVFLLDISQSMQDNIYAVAKHLEGMADRFERHDIDFQVGIVTFHHSAWNTILKNTVTVTQVTDDIDKVRKKLRKVKCSGGEKALNALMEAVHRVKFREGASRRFVFVTDEQVDGDYPPAEVAAALYRLRIHVDVIGVDEPFQRKLSADTGGMWIPIEGLTG
jgi:hypothetical protein